MSQSFVNRIETGAFDSAIARVAATFALNAAGACGSIWRSCASVEAGSTGGAQSCRSNAAVTCDRTSVGRTRWLNRSRMTICAPARPSRRYQFVWSSFTVGVVKLKVCGCSRRRPLTATALASIVTSYRVANGSGFFGSGVKIRIVVPDQRNVPGTEGAIRKNGARTGDGILPSVTIGSEKTTRTSLASARDATSPDGPALTTVSGRLEPALPLPGRGSR